MAHPCRQVLWVSPSCPCSPAPKPRWQEFVGRGESSELLLNQQRNGFGGIKRENRVVLGCCCISSCCGFGDTLFRARGDITGIKHWGQMEQLKGPQGSFPSLTNNPDCLNLPAEHQTHCSPHSQHLADSSLLSLAIWFSKVCPFPFPHNICLQGDASLPHSCDIHGKPQTGHPALPKACPQLASCTNRPLCRTKGIRGSLLTNF